MGNRDKVDGTIKDMDSSGDVGLFCTGLFDELLRHYSDRFTVIAENAAMLDVKEGVLQGVTTEAEHVSSQLLFALNIVNEELTNPHCHMSGQ